MYWQLFQVEQTNKQINISENDPVSITCRTLMWRRGWSLKYWLVCLRQTEAAVSR